MDIIQTSLREMHLHTHDNINARVGVTVAALVGE